MRAQIALRRADAQDAERIIGVGTVIPMTSCLRFPTRRAAARFS